MPLWEQRLVTVTAKWQGFSVVNDRGVVVVLFRSKGQPSQRVSMTGFDPEIRFREEDEERAITYIRQTYKLWSEADGDRTLKDCLKEAKSTSDVEPQAEAEVTWATIAAAMKEAKIDFGKKIQPQTWKTNWAPILDEAVRVLGRRNAPSDGYELLKAVLKNWTHAPTVQVECGRYLARWMEFAVRRFKVPRTWLITQADRDELCPKRPKPKLKAVLTDAEILQLIELADSVNPRWGNVFRLLTQFGLRPIELQFLSSRTNPETGKPGIWCDYCKVGGEEETEPRFLEAMYVRDANDQPMTWPLEQAMADGTLLLPTGRDGDVRKLSGSAVNCYIHRKSRSTGKPSGVFQAYWAELVEQYASRTPKEWLRGYSFRDTYSIRCHREGVPVASICDAMGHSEAVHARSYRTMTLKIRTRDFAAETGTIPLP